MQHSFCVSPLPLCYMVRQMLFSTTLVIWMMHFTNTFYPRPTFFSKFVHFKHCIHLTPLVKIFTNSRYFSTLWHKIRAHLVFCLAGQGPYKNISLISCIYTVIYFHNLLELKILAGWCKKFKQVTLNNLQHPFYYK